MRFKKSGYLFSALLFMCAFNSFAADAGNSAAAPAGNNDQPVFDKLDNPPWITLYEPTYVLPFYYTESPYYSVYRNNTPDQQNLQKLEFNFQISFKVPVWRQFILPQSALYIAYTQDAFWQSYNNSPFFRETNYQPELFVQTAVNKPLINDWQVKFINVGAMHQSNGRGGELERTWNRVYAEAILANQNWMVSVEPWYIFHDEGLNMHNPDIANYLGYGRTVVAYERNGYEVALNLRNVLESNFKRGAVQATWSFPISTHFKGYVKWFSGYGQSLIEYNHYTNAAGIGLALNDWI